MIERQEWQPRSLAEWQEEFNYRAAIIEYDGGYTRSDAEAMALKVVGGLSRSEIRRHNSR